MRALVSIVEILCGSVEFEVIGGRVEQFLNDCIENSVPITGVSATEFGLKARVPLRCYLKLHKVARKRRCRLKTTNKYGLYFWLWPFRKRYGIIVGSVLLVLAIVSFPRMVWTVQFHDFTQDEVQVLRGMLYELDIVEGSIPSKQQLESAQQNIFIHSEEYGAIQLNFVNGKLVVEKLNAVLPPVMENTEPAAIVALCDGIIQRVEVEGGFIEKKEGDFVKAGDVIISSLLVGKRDKLHTERADAKVYAEVSKEYETFVPFEYSAQTASVTTQSSYGIFAFNINFTLPFQPDNSGENTQYTVIKKPLTLFGLPLPATVVEHRIRQVEQVQVLLTKDQAADIARGKIYEEMAAELPECKIIMQSETITHSDDGVTLSMKIIATANIAKIQEGWNA